MRTLRRLLAVGLVLIALHLLAFGGEYTWFDLRRAERAVEEEQAGLATLHRQLDSLAALGDSLRTDLGILERVARERYGLIRPGEVLYRFVEPSPPSTSTPQDSSAASGTDRGSISQ